MKIFLGVLIIGFRSTTVTTNKLPDVPTVINTEYKSIKSMAQGWLILIMFSLSNTCSRVSSSSVMLESVEEKIFSMVFPSISLTPYSLRYIDDSFNGVITALKR